MTRPAISRRRILGGGLAATVAGCRRDGPSSVLVLGGTGWIGPHVVRRLIERQHRVTLFNRGRTDPDAFPELERLRGDRGSDLSALDGRTWDIVVDLSGARPAWVRESAERCADFVERYVLMSTTAVYAAFDRMPADETLPLRDRGGPDYGERKAACEREAAAALAGRVCLPRPVYAVGPGDPDRRIEAWIEFAERRLVELPGSPETAVLMVDVRDLAAFVVRLAEARATGPFNVATRISSADLFAECVAPGLRAAPTVRWRVGDARPPPMLHVAEGPLRHWGDLDVSRARRSGLVCRAVAETVGEVLDSLTGSRES